MYADVRVAETRHEELSVKRGRVDGLSQDESQGMGIRLLLEGAWGFACTSDLSPREVDRTVATALEVARASARVHRHPVDLGRPVSARGTYIGPVVIDPFSVSLESKIGLLLEAEAHLRADPRVPGRGGLLRGDPLAQALRVDRGLRAGAGGLRDRRRDRMHRRRRR